MQLKTTAKLVSFWPDMPSMRAVAPLLVVLATALSCVVTGERCFSPAELAQMNIVPAPRNGAVVVLERAEWSSHMLSSEIGRIVLEELQVLRPVACGCLTVCLCRASLSDSITTTRCRIC